MKGKKIIDKAKSVAAEYAAEHEKKRIAREEAIAAADERQRVRNERRIIENEIKIIERAKAIAADNDISFMEAVEIIKIVDSSHDSSHDENLEKIANSIKDLSCEVGNISYKISDISYKISK